MTFEPLVFLLLFVAIALGFGLGRFARRRSSRAADKQLWLQQSYLEGLNHLLNEEPDAAIDTFVANLEVNSATLETHFALGNLLRRRGEVERAIRIHQNLLARPSLSLKQQQQAQVELALDYMKSGLLDRAEILFKELLESSDIAIRGTALERLVEIYRDEKEWENAIAMAEQLCQRKMGRDISHWRALQAHFSCELASAALQKRDYTTARSWVQKALSFDRDNIRGRLFLGEIHMLQEQWDDALKVLDKIPSESPLYISEALPMVKECYRYKGSQQDFLRHLHALYQQSPCEMLLQQLAAAIAQEEGEAAARTFVERELVHFPVLAPMAQLLDLFEQHPECSLNYQQFSPILDKALSERAVYECRHCGFIGQQLHWCCPSCKHWGTMVSRLAGGESTGNLH